MSFTWFVISAGMGFCVGVYRKEIGRFVKSVIRNKVPAKEENQDPEPEEPKQMAPLKSSYDESAAVEQFIRVQDTFYGIYENLYQVAVRHASGDDPELSDWNARIASLEGCSDLKAFWAKIQPDVSGMLAFLNLCGVVRDDRNELTADEDTCYQYVEFGGSDIRMDMTYQILQPFWHRGDHLLEKGIIKEIEK